MAWEIAEYHGLAGLREVESDWRRLYQRMPAKSRFHSYDAHLAYVSNLCPTPELSRYVTLSDSGELRGICPLVARDDSSIGINLKAWGLPVHPHWPVTDVVCADDEARRALLPAVLSVLRARPERRHLLALGPLPACSALWDSVMSLKPGEFYARDAAASRVFDCTLSHDELMSRLTKHFRRNVRAHRRKLESLGEVLFSTASDEELLSGPLQDFLTVEASGWKGSGGTGSAIALHEGLAAYYRQLATSMAGPEDRCDINSLHVDGRCVAAQFCLKTGSEYTIMKIGYDEAYASLGPGQLMLDSTIQKCCEAEDITRLDLVSDSSWIRDWQAERIAMRQAYIAVGTFRGRSIMPLLRFRHGAARNAVLRFRQATGNRYARVERVKRRRAKAG